MTMVDLPKAVMRSESDCPMVDAGEGIKLQLLQVDVELGLWVIRTRFDLACRKHNLPRLKMPLRRYLFEPPQGEQLRLF